MSALADKYKEMTGLYWFDLDKAIEDATTDEQKAKLLEHLKWQIGLLYDTYIKTTEAPYHDGHYADLTGTKSDFITAIEEAVNGDDETSGAEIESGNEETSETPSEPKQEETSETPSEPQQEETSETPSEPQQEETSETPSEPQQEEVIPEEETSETPSEPQQEVIPE